MTEEPSGFAQQCAVCGNDDGTIIKLKEGEHRNFFPDREVDELRFCTSKNTDTFVHVLWAESS